MPHRNIIAALFLCILSVTAHAFTPEPPLADASKEILAQSLFQELRCVVCEGQSLAESDAALARQMRSEIREMVRDDHAKSEILAFFQTRYGDAILMSPPLSPHTYLLWGAPLIFLLLGALLLWRRRT